MKLKLYWSYATRSLLRGGQRTVLAVFCVAVGVMSIVALQLVGLSVNQALIGNVIAANGGDLRMSASIAPLRPRDLTFFDQLKRQGRITDYATTYDANATITQPSGDEETFSLIATSSNFPLVGQASFIAPSANLTLQQVVSGNHVAMSEHVFADLHAHIGSTYTVKLLDGRLVPIVVVAEFREDGIFRGPQVIIARDTLASLPGPNGIALPVQYGTVYAIVPSANLQQVKRQISQTFPSVRVNTAQDLLQQRQKQVEQIQLFLRIVGLLALFIGGIGIINTMQVLLRRRQVEIAMLKTSGYSHVDLYWLFGLEAALLGVMGGIVGVGAGIGASYLVRAVVGQTFSLQLPIVIDSITIISGPIIGLATALIFGLLPIVQASQIRPLAILRESMPADGRIRANSWLTTAGLLILLSVLFVALATTILGDVLTALIAVYGGAGVIGALALGLGLLVVAIARLPVYERPSPRILLWILGSIGGVVLATLAFAGLSGLGLSMNALAARAGNSTLGIYMLAVCGGLGLVLLGGALVFLLATLLDGIVMFFPRAWKTPVMLAYRNMGRQRIRTTTTLMALFVGIFAIGLVLILGQGIKDTINSTLSTLFIRNVFVIVPPSQQSAVTAQLPHLPGVDKSKTIVNPVARQVYPIFIGGQDLNTLLRRLPSSDRGAVNGLGAMQGFDLKGGSANIPTIVLKSGRNLQAADAGGGNIIVSGRLQRAPIRLRLGDTIIVQSADGTVTRELKIVGFYDDTNPMGNPNFASVLADANVVRQLGGAQTLEVFSLKVDPDQFPRFKKELARAVPMALVISIVDVDAIVNQVLNNLIIMLTTIASLAMIAGLIIIANAVALAMLERQREIGILKSVGYTSNAVLATVLIENGLVGALGSLVAMLLVSGAITILSQFVLQIPLSVGPALAALLIGVTALVTMLVALLVSWQAVRVRPLEVLRYE